MLLYNYMIDFYLLFLIFFSIMFVQYICVIFFIFNTWVIFFCWNWDVTHERHIGRYNPYGRSHGNKFEFIYMRWSKFCMCAIYEHATDCHDAASHQWHQAVRWIGYVSISIDRYQSSLELVFCALFMQICLHACLDECIGIQQVFSFLLNFIYGHPWRHPGILQFSVRYSFYFIPTGFESWISEYSNYYWTQLLKFFQGTEYRTFT